MELSLIGLTGTCTIFNDILSPTFGIFYNLYFVYFVQFGCIEMLLDVDKELRAV